MDLGAYGATSDDETNVYTHGHIGLAGEIDGDKSGFIPLTGRIAHDPEQVDT